MTPGEYFWMQLSKLPIAQGSQNDLAKRLGISASVIGNWRRFGVLPKPHHLTKVAQLTGKPLSYFFPSDVLPKTQTEKLLTALELPINDETRVDPIKRLIDSGVDTENIITELRNLITNGRKL